MKSGSDIFIVYVLFLVLNLECALCSGSSSSFPEKIHKLFRRETKCDNDETCKEPEIRIHPKNITLTRADVDRKRLRCKAIGNPVPTISWKKITYPSKDGTPVDTVIDDGNKYYRISSETKSHSKYSQIVVSTLRFLNWGESPAVYACVASARDQKVQSRNAFVTFHKDNNKAPFTPVPGDQRYKFNEACLKLPEKSTCSHLLDPRKTIYTDHGKHKYDITEKMLDGIARTLDNSHVSKQCQPYVLPFLCYHNLPYCVKGQVKPKQLCQQSCIRLSTEICSKEFVNAKTDDTLKVLIPSSCASLPLTNCTNLTSEMQRVQDIRNGKIEPTGNDNESTKKPKTLKNELRDYIDSKVDYNDNCYSETGEDYRGILNRTFSGATCLPWQQVLDIKTFDGHRFCRNPKGIYEKPWCYVDVGGKEDVQFCDVPLCDPTIPSSGQYQTTNILYTIIPCLFFALALSLAIITFAWRRHKQHFYQSAPSSPKQVVPRVSPKIQELNREDLCDFRLLGDGNIGRVFTADYTGCKDNRTFTACVAVKAIVEKASPKQIEDFVREAETRANFKHENVIALIGVISKEEPLSLIYEYTEFGDLHEYLLRHSPNYSDAHANDDCGPLQFSDLLAIATQIASGMSYLSTHAFVHKDLAARNCLIADNGITKISDFSGLCDMYAGDYYRAPGRPPLPVRWMSPEAITHSRFTTASDVWSYGILLWEIFSYGSRPFFGLSNYQAMQHILENDLLPLPDDCPKQIFFTMNECWEKQADSRPTFAEIYNKLKSMNDLPTSHPPVQRVQYSPDMSMDAPDMPIHPGDIPMHPTEMSIHSMSSVTTNRQCNRRDVLPSAFTRASISNSQGHSLHSRHSSNHSVNSAHHHPGSMQSMGHSIPPSISSMPRSVPGSAVMNGHHRPMRNGHAHHSLPRDGYHSLGRDKNLVIMDGHYPMHNMDHRAISVNSNHHNGSLSRHPYPHSTSGYISSANSYAPSYAPSYPPSLTGPPASSVFSRQSSSHANSRAPSIKSHDSTPRNHNGTPNGHVYL